ncbi:hypothetical protein [Bacteroides sp.]|uniref:hypothetical protein n=1 Tax=Bacteroides sp. TaxID=29523 RepID=UPI0025C30641|nr:hypothetical protein [Bacteroides sp.]
MSFSGHAPHYEIAVTLDSKKENVTDLKWKIEEAYKQEETAGVYFLQTNLD